MAFVKCANGHLYYEQYKKCPYCGDSGRGKAVDQEAAGRFGADDSYKSDLDDVITENRSEHGVVTIGYTTKNGESLVAGWLVCVEGEELGRDYPLYQGYNRIGRSYRMDVCITTDRSVSRENHCAVVYDEKQNEFYVVEGKNLAYLNDQLVEGSVELQDRDVIQIGNTRLEFVAFCKGDRKWT